MAAALPSAAGKRHGTASGWLAGGGGLPDKGKQTTWHAGEFTQAGRVPRKGAHADPGSQGRPTRVAADVDHVVKVPQQLHRVAIQARPRGIHQDGLEVAGLQVQALQPAAGHSMARCALA